MSNATDWTRAEVKPGDRVRVTGHWDRDAGVQTFEVTISEVHAQGLGVNYGECTTGFLPFWGLHQITDLKAG